MTSPASFVAFDRVTVRYPGTERAAVADITLRVDAGERVALVGPSGSGKSTLLALAAGLRVPSSGKVSVLGVDGTVLGSRTNRDTRSRIGIVSQDFSLVGSLRTATNVAAGRLGQRTWFGALWALWRPGPLEEIHAALGRVGIAEKIWERTDHLSGGEQQRTAIARVLFQAPDLLLADEPVSALDPARSKSVIEVLTDEFSSADRGLLVSMHDAPLALEYCDRIVGLCEGRVVFDLPATDVSEAVLADLYHLDEQPGL